MESDTPVAIRYPRGGEDETIKAHFYGGQTPCDIALRCDFGGRERVDCVLITHGRIASEAIRAKRMLAKEGIALGLMLAERLKPYDELALRVAERLPFGCPIVTLEEEIRAGGMGMLLTDALGRIGALDGRRISMMATDDRFGIQETNEPIYKTVGIDADSIADCVRDLCPILQKGSF